MRVFIAALATLAFSALAVISLSGCLLSGDNYTMEYGIGVEAGDPMRGPDLYKLDVTITGK